MKGNVGQAWAVANMAVQLEVIKEAFPPELKSRAESCAVELHHVAAHLAGDDIEEVYDLHGDIQKGEVERDMTLSLAGQLGNVSRNAHLLSAELWALVDAYDEGDMEAVQVQLKAMSERRKDCKVEVH